MNKKIKVRFVHPQKSLFIFMLILVFSATTYASSNTITVYRPGFAGYVIVPTNYISQINGSWKVQFGTTPTLSLEAKSSQWIGIGGIINGSLIQIGTESDFNFGVLPNTYAWYELLNCTSCTQIQIPDFTVHPGDTIFASIRLASNTATNCFGKSCSFVFTLNDISLSENYSNTVEFKSELDSADWIDEDLGKCANPPTECWSDPYYTLTPFGIAGYGNQFTSQSKTDYVTIGNSIGPVGAFINDRFQMVDQNGELTYTSNLTSDLASFNITRLHMPLFVAIPIKTKESTIYAAQSEILNSSGAIGGTGLYSYQWLESKPVNTLVFTTNTNCLAPTTRICNFTTTTNTILGTYGFKLRIIGKESQYQSRSYYL